MPAPDRHPVAHRSLCAVAALLIPLSLAGCSREDGGEAGELTPSFTGAPADASAGASQGSSDRDPQSASPGEGSTAASDGASGSRDVASGTACVGGEDITVSVDGASPVITGDCGVVDVVASNVSGNIETAREVHLSGSNNSLLGTGWGNLTIDGTVNSANVDSVDRLRINGNTNTVISTDIGDIEVHGDANVLNWNAGAPGPSVDSGKMNSYTR